MHSDLHNLRAPDILRELPGWLVWRFEPNGDKKPRKMPYYISGAKRHWTQGTAADRKNLTTFDEAKRVAVARGFDGVGLALMPEFGVTALDFDDCVDNGVIHPQVEALTAGTYTEFSPSGNGIRAFVLGSLGTGKSLNTARHPQPFGFEVFDCNGFVTFTGRLTDTTDLTGSGNYLAPISAELKAFRDARLCRAREPVEYGGSGEPTLGLSDQELHQILAALPNDLTYDEWFNVCCALHHETEGEGFALFDEWSLSSPKGSTTEYNMERWQSCGNYNGAPFTCRSLLRFARDELHVDTGIDIDTASADEFPVIPEVPGGRFNIRSHSDFASQVRSVRWIVKDLLPHAQLGVLFGESGSGKTFVSYDLCAAVCRGVEQWNGHRVTKGRVLYVVAEGVAGFVNRIKAYCHQQGINPSDIDMDVISDLTPNLLEPAQITDLIKDIKQRQPYDLIVMDTFAQVMPGANENSGEDVGKALAECKRIHRHTGAMVLLVHHSGKDASKGARGWSGLRAAADVELEVLRSDELRSISVTKLKDGRDGAQIGFKLHTVVLGSDEEGDDITSCIVEYNDQGRVARGKNSTVGPKERQILMVINEVYGLGVGEKVPLAELIEAAAAQLTAPVDGKRDNRKRDVSRCIESLSAKNYLLVEDGLVILSGDKNA